MTPTQAAFHLLSSNQLTILIFHRVLAASDPLFPGEPDAVRFEEMMIWIKSWFNVLPLDTAVEALKTGKLPPRAASITFDDGYADNHDVALPILKKHGLSATFFIATGFLDGGRMWNDTVIESIKRSLEEHLDLYHLGIGLLDIRTLDAKRIAIAKILDNIKYKATFERTEIANQIAVQAKSTLPTNLMMSNTQVIAMRNAGMQIGAHTVSHPILARTASLAHAKQEMSDSKNTLEALLQEPIDLFAYPNGKAGNDYLPEHAKLAKDLGFTAAVSTDWGTASTSTDLFNLPRFTPWDKTKTRFCLRLLNNLWRS